MAPPINPKLMPWTNVVDLSKKQDQQTHVIRRRLKGGRVRYYSGDGWSMFLDSANKYTPKAAAERVAKQLEEGGIKGLTLKLYTDEDLL